MPQWDYRKIDLNNVPRKTDDVDLLNDAGEQRLGPDRHHTEQLRLLEARARGHPSRASSPSSCTINTAQGSRLRQVTSSPQPFPP
jgi:hypothetical protein